MLNPIPKLFTKQDITANFKDAKQYNNWISTQKKIILLKIRSNLYALIDKSTNDVYTTKFEITSKISQTSYSAYHSV